MTFTPQTPTQPGFYAWKGYSDALPRPMEVSEVQDNNFNPVLVVDSGAEVSQFGGLWCRLVAVDEVITLNSLETVMTMASDMVPKSMFTEEVEKAWRECEGRWAICATNDEGWSNSRARRVVEGTE